MHHVSALLDYSSDKEARFGLGPFGSVGPHTVLEPIMIAFNKVNWHRVIPDSINTAAVCAVGCIALHCFVGSLRFAAKACVH